MKRLTGEKSLASWVAGKKGKRRGGKDNSLQEEFIPRKTPPLSSKDNNNHGIVMRGSVSGGNPKSVPGKYLVGRRLEKETDRQPGKHQVMRKKSEISHDWLRTAWSRRRQQKKGS